MKFLFSVILSVLVSLLAYPQDSISSSKPTSSTIKKNHKFIFSLEEGLAFPVGQLALYERNNGYPYYLADNIAGSALSGYTSKFDFKYIFGKYFGLTSSIYYSENATKTPSQKELFPYSSSAMGGGSTRTSYSYNSQKWKSIGVLIGVSAFAKIGICTFILNLGNGVQFLFSPKTILRETGYVWQMNWTYTKPYTIERVQEQVISTNYVFVINPQLQFRISRRFSLKISCDSYISQTVLKGNQFVVYDIDDGTGTTIHSENSELFSISKNVNFVCCNFGVCFGIK